MNHLDHSHYRDAWKKLKTLAVDLDYPKGKIILVTGASRSGKSYLLDQP